LDIFSLGEPVGNFCGQNEIVTIIRIQHCCVYNADFNEIVYLTFLKYSSTNLYAPSIANNLV